MPPRHCSQRLTSVQAALEQRTTDWQVAEAARQQLQRAMSRRAALAARQAAESTSALVGYMTGSRQVRSQGGAGLVIDSYIKQLSPRLRKTGAIKQCSACAIK